MENNLKQIRQLRGLTQMQLSNKSGIPRTTIASIEQGALPNVLIAVQLAHSLDVSVEDIFPLPA